LAGFVDRTSTTLLGRGIGGRRSNMPFTRLKIAVFAPMPRASVRTATDVKPGFFSNLRKANFKSFIAEKGNIEH